MAKVLKENPPTSSVRRLLDTTAVTRALVPAAHSPSPAISAGSIESAADAVSERAKPVKREFVLTPTTEETLTRLVHVYRNATGTRLSNSHVIRIVLRGIAHGLDAIEREASHLGLLKLPSNAKGREAEREQFETALASTFVAAMRTLPALARD